MIDARSSKKKPSMFKMIEMRLKLKEIAAICCLEKGVRMFLS